MSNQQQQAGVELSEATRLAKILRGMCECGPAPDDLWERDQPDGDPFVMRAAELLEQFAADRQRGKVEPVASTVYECPKGCGCWWRDNGDGSMSLFDGAQKSCSICENLPLSRLRKVALEDNLFIEDRGDGVWLLCVEKVYADRTSAHAACQKWKQLAAPQAEKAPSVQAVAEVTHVVGGGPNDVSIRWNGGLAQVGAKLYSAAPQQPSVPLTDVQIDKITLTLCTGHMATLSLHRKHARAIEAAHGIAAAPKAVEP